MVKEWGEYYENVHIGGPAFDDRGEEFIPGQYVRNDIIFTSRGCDRKCPWCYIHKREGKNRELKITNGHVIEDSNFLMCSDEHVSAVFDMLRKNNKETFFNGGFDTRLFRKWHVGLLESVRVGEIYFACDSKKVFPYLKKVVPLLINKPQSWKLCYVLLGYEETTRQARKRLLEVRDLGFVPVPMLYQKDEFIHHKFEWKDLEKEFAVQTKYMQMVDEWRKEMA